MDQTWVDRTVKARADVAVFDLPGEMTTGDAYRLQDAYVAGVGKPVGGYKLAINGAAQMAHFGVSEGASARVFADEIYPDGVSLPLAGFGSVSVEPELCAVLGEGVVGDGTIDRAATIAAIDRFHAAIEVIDQRGFAVPQLTLQQAIGLNVFNAGIVMGAASIPAEELDPETLRATLSLDGEMVGDVTGGAPQDPIEAVQWLINHARRRGVELTPGMIVMCGTHLPIRLLDDHVRQVDITMSGLGSVGFTLTD